VVDSAHFRAFPRSFFENKFWRHLELFGAAVAGSGGRMCEPQHVYHGQSGWLNRGSLLQAKALRVADPRSNKQPVKVNQTKSR
jgi:hypothetical protein